MPKVDARTIAHRIATKKPELKWIAGKWFDGPEEIRNIDRYMTVISPDITSPSILDDTKAMHQIIYGEAEGKWPELPIIAEARAQAAVQPLAFPLNPQQLKIIRLLLEGDKEIAFVITGIGGSGKSTYLNIIKQIFGDVGACTLSELGGYQLAEALRHRLIASDELSADELNNSVVKTVISRQSIQVNPKFARPYQVRAQSSMVWCCNKPPRIDLTDSGIMRRIVYYSINKKIENPDPSLKSHEYTHEELVNIVKAALDIDMTNWFDDFRLDTYKYMTVNNSVWLCRDATDYDDYVSKAKDKHLRPYSEPIWHEISDMIDEWKQQCKEYHDYCVAGLTQTIVVDGKKYSFTPPTTTTPAPDEDEEEDDLPF